MNKVGVVYLKTPLGDDIRNRWYAMLPKIRAERLAARFNEGFGDEELAAYALLRVMLGNIGIDAENIF